MADNPSSRVDDGKGPPPGTGEKTTAGKPLDERQLPGGSMDAAQIPIGMNAVDRDQLPSGGLRPEELRIEETPEAPDPRPPAKK